LTPELAEKFDYEVGSGLVVSDVLQGGPAAQAGIRPGNLIEEVNRQPVTTLEELNKLLNDGETDKLLLRVRSGSYSTYVVLTKK
jgi:serine protease Do